MSIIKYEELFSNPLNPAPGGGWPEPLISFLSLDFLVGNDDNMYVTVLLRRQKVVMVVIAIAEPCRSEGKGKLLEDGKF